MGPFGREGISYIHKKGRWFGQILVKENGTKIIQALTQCSVLSAMQAIELSGCGKNSKDLLPMMVEKGHLDSYVADRAPKLYALGEKSAELLGRKYRIWDTGGLLKLAAANQFWLQTKKIWPDLLWDTSGEFPVLIKFGVRFTVLAPRLGQLDKMFALRFLNKCQDRVFVVAPDDTYALEIALNCPPNRMVRYTWDDALKDGHALYQLVGKTLVLDTSFKRSEKILEKPVNFVDRQEGAV